MPFVARHLETDKRIDITQIPHPREVLKSGDCVCQICGVPFVVKAGLVVRPHFAHYAQTCEGLYDSHPESREHLEAKLFLRNALPKYYEQYTQASIDLEVPVNMPWRKRGRVADLLITFPMGWRIAHEIQLASITVEKLKERTDDYLQAGIDVVWWLGRSADTQTNHQWCCERFGCSFRVKGID